MFFNSGSFHCVFCLADDLKDDHTQFVIYIHRPAHNDANSRMIFNQRCANPDVVIVRLVALAIEKVSCSVAYRHAFLR